MKIETLLPIIISVIIVLVTILTAVITRVKRQRRWKKEEEGPSPQGETIPRGASGESAVDGITFLYKHFRGTDKAPPNFSITMPCVAAGAFTITRESKFDRFFKRLGICAEIETYDQDFDNTFYINTSDIPFTRLCLEKTENRRSIRALFELGFNHLKSDGKTITITWRNFPRRQLMEVSTMEKAASQLSVLSQSLPKITPFETPAPTTWKYKRFAAFAIPSLLLVTGIIALIIGLTTYKPLDTGLVFLHSLKYSLPLFVVFIWISLRLLRGRSSSHWELIAVFFISLFAFPLAGFGYNAFLNGALDQSPPAAHQVMVLEKFYKKHKNSYSYYITTQSWREQSNETLKVSHSFFNQMESGTSRVTVTTKPGKFGYEWLVDVY